MSALYSHQTNLKDVVMFFDLNPGRPVNNVDVRNTGIAAIARRAKGFRSLNR